MLKQHPKKDKVMQLQKSLEVFAHRHRYETFTFVFGSTSANEKPL